MYARFALRVVAPLVSLLCAGLIGPGAAAAAGPLSCFATAPSSPTLRSEGENELISDIVITCTGGIPVTAGQRVPEANISLAADAPITSRLLAPQGAPVDDAELLIDDPAAGSQTVCTSYEQGCPVSAGGSGYAVGSPNVFFALNTGSNFITWFGVPLDPPGSGPPLTLRLTNVRVNASVFGSSGVGPPASVEASVAASGPVSLPISNSTLSVGSVQKGLSFSLRSADDSTSLMAPVGVCSGAPVSATLRAAEAFPAAFKTRSVAGAGATAQATPGTVYETESGLYNPAFPAPFTSAGLADSGTRVAFTFTGPSDASVTLPTTVSLQGSSGTTVMVASASGPFTPVSGSSAVLTLSGGTATAVYEITGSDPTLLESLDAAVSIAMPADDIGSDVDVSAYFVPAGNRSASAGPVPGFVNDSTPLTLATGIECPLPIAAFTHTPEPARATHPVSFDGTGSSQPDGTITNYQWSFGDGATGSGPTPAHAYAAAATYDVTLTVTGSFGQTASVTHPVIVLPRRLGTFSCAATGAVVLGDALAVANPPDSPCAADSASVLSYKDILTVVGGQTSLTPADWFNTDPSPTDHASAHVAVAELSIFGIKVSAISSYARAQCTASGEVKFSGTSSIAKLVVEGVVYAHIKGKLDLTVGPIQIDINDTLRTSHSLTQRAIWIQTPLGNVIVSEAKVDSDQTPCA